MNLTTTLDGNQATIAIEGKLSVATSPDLEKEISSLPATVSDFTLDLSDLEYISSAGLRVLVSSQKLMSKREGTLMLMHPTDEVYDIFEMTGLSEVFTIKR